jgi:hypothetical protein
VRDGSEDWQNVDGVGLWHRRRGKPLARGGCSLGTGTVRGSGHCLCKHHGHHANECQASSRLG